MVPVFRRASVPSPPVVSSRPPISSRPPSVSLPPSMVSQLLEVVGSRDSISTPGTAPTVVVLVGLVVAGSLVATSVYLVAALDGLAIVGGCRVP